MHGDILQVVQLAEDAELRKLGDACEKNETEVGVAVLQGRIEVAHHIAQDGQGLFLVYHIEQRCIIFINEDDHLPPRLSVGSLD